MKISGNKTVYEKLFKRQRYVIPDHLINKDNVFVEFDQETGGLNVSFSEDILKEFSFWSKKRVKDLMYDLQTSVCFFFMHQPWNSNNMEKLYDQIFVMLHQVY